MTPLDQLLQHKIVAILRGCQPERVLDIAEALAAGGIRLMEITLNSPDALEMISRTAKAMGDKILVGAGTVLTAAEAEIAIAVGARFIVSPSLDADTIRLTKNRGAVSIPGAFTPTEILAAWRAGADIVKVFPASVGASWFRDLRGPFPHIPLMATGGVNLHNIREFRAAGVVAYGIGSALVPADQDATAGALDLLRQRAVEYIKALV